MKRLLALVTTTVALAAGALTAQASPSPSPTPTINPNSYMAQRAAMQKTTGPSAVLARPVLRVPFRCNERWTGASRSGHSPSYWSLDFNWGAGSDDLGKPVKTSASGLVVRSSYDAGGYGNYIEIAHGDGWHTLYAHLQIREVGVNDRVTDSTRIGRVGGTGNVSGPHLHYEQIKDGAVVAAKFGQSTWATYPGPDTYMRIADC